MRTRSLSWDEDEVRKKKTLILVLAFLLIPLLLGLYAAVGPEGGLIAGATPTALLSPSAVATATVPVPAFTATATPTASATPVAKATATPVSTPTPVPPEPTATPVATLIALEPTPTASATPVAKATATPVSTPTPVPPEPTATPVATLVALEPTPTPTVALTATLAAPVVTTPPDGSVLKDDRPTIAGTAPPNTTVQVYDDGSLVGTATADAQGDWSLVPGEPLEPGERAVTAVASDDAGRASVPSGAVTLTVVIEHLPVTGGSWSERWLDRLFRIVFH
jgi:hypothetical protein